MRAITVVRATPNWRARFATLSRALAWSKATRLRSSSSSWSRRGGLIDSQAGLVVARSGLSPDLRPRGGRACAPRFVRLHVVVRDAQNRKPVFCLRSAVGTGQQITEHMIALRALTVLDIAHHRRRQRRTR